MPELPEVETVCRGLRPLCVGGRIELFELRSPGLRYPFAPNLPALFINRVIRAINRRGKYIIMETDGAHVLVMHLGMSGRFSMLMPGEPYMPAKHDHVVLTLQGGARLVFNDARRFGFMIPQLQKNWQMQKPFDVMGPEPLGNEFSGAVLRKKLRGRQTPIKAALLDQAILAGVGNIYASEALFQAGIHPRKMAGTLNAKEAEKLVVAIRDVLSRAIDAGGSTLKDYRRADGELGYFQHDFAVYDRAGLACPGCTCDIKQTGGIQKYVQGGRSTYFCPARQKNTKAKERK